VDFRHSPSIPDYLSSQSDIAIHTESFIDERCEAFSVIKDELLLLSEERFGIRVRSSMEWHRVDGAVTSLGDRDSRILVFHIDMVKGGWTLFIVIGKSKLRKLKRSFH
jgi:hypothetical protein